MGPGDCRCYRLLLLVLLVRISVNVTDAFMPVARELDCSRIGHDTAASSVFFRRSDSPLMTIQQGVGQCRGVDPGVPVVNRQLAGQDGGAIIDNFQQVMQGIFLQWYQAPVIRINTSTLASCCNVRPKLPSPWAMRNCSNRRGVRIYRVL